MKSFKEYIQEEGSGGLFDVYKKENPKNPPYNPTTSPENKKLSKARVKSIDPIKSKKR